MYQCGSLLKIIGTTPLRRAASLPVRQNFSPECEKQLNKQINLELKASHDYLAMAYHFDRSDVAQQGIFKFFQHASGEERSHAEQIMEYMNKRGGQIILNDIPTPRCNYDSALAAMREALEMEKTVNESLLEAHKVASDAGDPNMCDFIEEHFLQEQVESQKQLADYITQMERCEKDLGSFVFDLNLQKAHKGLQN